MTSARSGPSTPTVPGGPLSGVRVLDLTTFLSGPFATQILSDLGAEVIKVESLGGDLSRSIPPHFVGDDSVYFLANNRGKRSIAVDLKTDDGRQVVLDLIARSDVVIENFRPGVCRRLGLDPDRIRADQPDLVWASISGFGQVGPLRDQPAYDMVVQAMSGVMSLTGEPGGPAVRLGIPAGDLIAGMYATIAVMAALLDRPRSGGRTADVSMLDGQLAMLSYQGAYSLVAGVTPGPQGRGHDSIPTYRSFAGRDGREFVVTANTERMWQGLCDALGRPDLIADERFVDGRARLTHRDQLWPILEKEFARRTAREWVRELATRAVPVSLIKTVPEALRDADEAGRDMIVDLAHPDGRQARVLGNPVRYVGESARPATYPPGLGEHTVAILRDILGRPPEEVDRLLSNRAVATDPRPPGTTPAVA
ncbi:CoA transferase [Micromonospora sp. WMMD1082]|uniref:CaiB/BaiF CoA transferase family protein n=1 Tax=Micromonospora sp. WMMD1082 TaxID=3016104 RepID=UPI002416BDEA|nr:CoA transferase [Micromonospora sp. WMMD1082]MDG4798336.1 CoA transferase [Micromonospora sp. WMMD1082]